MTRIRYDVCAKHINKAGERQCGDNSGIIHDKNGGVSFFIVDGLGSGFTANLHAVMASKLIFSLLERGEEPNAIINTVSGSMEKNKVRGIDYCAFTLVTAGINGIISIAAFNMPEPLLLRHGRIFPVKYSTQSSDGRKIRIANFLTKSYDTLAAFSDGVTKAGIGGDLNLGLGVKNVASYLSSAYKPRITSEKMADLLISVCDSLYQGRPGDDVSAVILRAQKEN